MPAVSLVVCVYQERDLLRRLLTRAADCYDDLVVVHDGPDTLNVRAVVAEFGGRFFEHPKIGSLEGQSPFAWKQAAHDWILRLDADEFPSDEMAAWLKQFRAGPEPGENVSGFTCGWPLWNGTRAVSKCWPLGRIFFFHRQRVRFFGMIEQVPIPDGKYQPLDFVLHHQPLRKSYGLRKLIVRKQAYRWRAIIARSLLGKPTDLPCWRWDSGEWSGHWRQLREQPWRTALRGLVMGSLRALRDQWRAERRFFFTAAISGPVHHTMIAREYSRQRRLAKTAPAGEPKKT